ncbi:LOW QUALITY PROTEIN: hypothetical protein CVT25_015092 [Psilocybe cyanescens]|uniref:Uncharacterized protein n=1 Tax=Psilocybe cyanescens TaxID=93625 RepID=A0A409WS86_PSICY|nr:LOW QUALITY PROTEIN: hypothetical protein CVT25_015092 [Psilocybe cyanescens]
MDEQAQVIVLDEIGSSMEISEYLSSTSHMPWQQTYFGFVDPLQISNRTLTLLQGIDPPFHTYRFFSRAIKKTRSESGSFCIDFLNPKTSIVVLAFQRRAKKA